MDRPQLPLNALRAFEAAARHLSLTRAAIELCVTQAALSHQIRGLEARLGVTLFRRVPRGLVLTAEGAALAPVLSQCLDRMSEMLDRFADGHLREVLHVGVVGTFAVRWLLPRLGAFETRHPFVDLRLYSHNNRIDPAGEGLDLVIRFGDGAWRATEALPLIHAPLSPHVGPGLLAAGAGPGDLAVLPLLRSYRDDEWPSWFAAAGGACPALRGPVFDTSLALADAAEQGYGAALLPVPLFAGAVAAGRLARPFAVEVDTGRYWLTRVKSRAWSPGMTVFRDWLLSEAVIRP